MADASRPRPVVLCILDGFGEGSDSEANAAQLASTPAIDALRTNSPTTSIGASGPAVGLPEGQMGSSEIGHLTLGAGRLILSEMTRINDVIKSKKFGRTEFIDQTMRIAAYRSCPLHLFGLLSDGGIHSSFDHLIKLIDLAHFHEVEVIVHAFTDGRDSPPRSAMTYLDKLELYLEGKGKIGTICGRYYAMDRDERWDRTYQAFHAIVRDKALGPTVERAETAFDAVSLAYGRGQNDEFIEPTRIGDYQGVNGEFMADFAANEPVWEWTGEDVGFAFNFRGDRMRQLSAMLTREGLPDEIALDLLQDRHYPVLAFPEHCYATMTHYGDDLKLPVAFPKQTLDQTLGELVAAAGMKQLRCAETEKFPHVTYFFSGGREELFDGETRAVVKSARLVDTYDEKPEMSAPKVGAKVLEGIESGEHDLIVVNFANPDMVGHTGKLDAAVKAVEAVDDAIGKIAEKVRAAGGALIVTADHGNCETMVDAKGRPHTAHTTNPVPFIYLNERDRGATLRQGGRLCDVAPTVLELLELAQPASMSGVSLRRPDPVG